MFAEKYRKVNIWPTHNTHAAWTYAWLYIPMNMNMHEGIHHASVQGHTYPHMGARGGNMPHEVDRHLAGMGIAMNYRHACPVSVHKYAICNSVLRSSSLVPTDVIWSSKYTSS